MLSLRHQKPAAGTERGFTLIEVLVTVIILAIGLLGLAGLQLGGLRYSFSAYQRSQATIMANDIVDRMRANRTVAEAGAYDIDIGDDPSNVNCTGAGKNCSASSMADADLYEWKQALAAVLPTGDGSVGRNGGLFVITIQWDDTRGEEEPKSLAVETAL
ncbi:MAG: type IV pilus modification protein PilV [Gammaproteobacteria bacterium]|nr:type IV pilus modification protein PilV [Gammaproteobacteria bacterium]